MTHYNLIDIKNLEASDAIDESQGFEALLKKHKLSSDEYQIIKKNLGRTPSYSELGVFSAMWSEHCSYKSSRPHLKKFPVTGEHVVVGPGENAGVVRVAGDQCVAFKMESHNHPSYIEPFHGAATGVGGILRDVFCMGARPIANLNCLRFGKKTHPRTPYLFKQAVKGIGDYGNCVGVPTVGGSIHFDATYDANCLVNAMSVGLIDANKIFKGFATGKGNYVVYLGSATGRDGVHGATMASDSFASQDQGEKSTIQVGDPFREKLLIEATLSVLEKGLVVGLQDMGAAGLTSSSVEMAGRAGNGILIDLSCIPVRTQNMTPYELLLSESQERMLMVIEPGKWPELKAELDQWELESCIIGIVTETGRFQCSFAGKLEVDLPVNILTDMAPIYERPFKEGRVGEPLDTKGIVSNVKERGVEAVILNMLKDIGDKTPIFRQYDQHIGTKTVFGPDEGGAPVLWLRDHEIANNGEEFAGIAIATACHERYCKNNPRTGAALALIQAARKIASRGGFGLGATDCLNFGNPQVPEVMWEFKECVEGLADACTRLNIPIVSGNVSLYNETDGVSIYPTPMLGVVGKVPDIRFVPASTVTKPVDLYLVSPSKVKPQFGGGLLGSTLSLDIYSGIVPEVDWEQVLEGLNFITTLARQQPGEALAVRDVGSGGLIITLLEMMRSPDLTLDVKMSQGALSWESVYFGEYAACFVIATTSSGATHKFLGASALKHNQIQKIGTMAENNAQEHNIDGVRLNKKQVLTHFQNALNFN